MNEVKNFPKPRVQFLALKDEIFKMRQNGLDVLTTYDLLVKQGKISMSYSSFNNYINKHIILQQRDPLKPLLEEIIEMLKQGCFVKTIYEKFQDEGKISMSYNTFNNYLKRHIFPYEVLEQNKSKGEAKEKKNIKEKATDSIVENDSTAEEKIEDVAIQTEEQSKELAIIEPTEIVEIVEEKKTKKSDSTKKVIGAKDSSTFQTNEEPLDDLI